MAFPLALLTAAGAVVLCIVIFRVDRETTETRSAALAQLNGQWVGLGLTRGKSLILEEEGFLQIDGARITLDDGERVVEISAGQIRWITDPWTGDQVAGPW